jgi:hypothetical protein
MSIMDHTLHTPSQRDDNAHHATRGGRTWFSRKTIWQAQHFTDMSWTRLLFPTIVAILLMLMGQLVLVGEIAALSNLAGLITFVISLNGLLSKAWVSLTNP